MPKFDLEVSRITNRCVSPPKQIPMPVRPYPMKSSFKEELELYSIAEKEL